MLKRPAQPIEHRDHHLITRPVGRQQRLPQLRTPRQLPPTPADKDLLVGSGRQRVVLRLRMLISRRDTPIADQISVTRTPDDVTLARTRLPLHTDVNSGGRRRILPADVSPTNVAGRQRAGPRTLNDHPCRPVRDSAFGSCAASVAHEGPRWAGPSSAPPRHLPSEAASCAGR
jgi:hypothetical protein